jgi:hypothetical protein
MPETRPVDVCKLCHLTKPLCDSHYLPKKLYSFVGAAQLKNPQPVMSIDGELRQSSLQYRGYVFCETCEAELNHGGEKWVIQQVPREYGGRFPLREALSRLRPLQSGDRITAFNVLGKSDFDLEKLVYFGLSIFWRAAVHKWSTTAGQIAEEVDLGAFEEPLREFLLGTGPLPNQNIVLALDVSPEVPVFPALHPVVGEQHAGFERLWFYIPGLVFLLWLGQNIPRHFKGSSLANGVITSDVGLARSIRQFTSEGLKSQKLGPKLPEMMRQIDDIRSRKPSKLS